MNTFTATDLVLDPTEYRRVRPELRARVIPIRAGRRVHVGDLICLEFENATTLSYQVQEMLFVEADFSPSAVAHEVSAYQRYLPTGSSLTATFFVEAEDVATVKDELHRLNGIQHSVWLTVGPKHTVLGIEIPGPDEDGPSQTTASVHFLRFELDQGARAAFLDPATPIGLQVSHPQYQASVLLPASTRAALASELT